MSAIGVVNAVFSQIRKLVPSADAYANPNQDCCEAPYRLKVGASGSLCVQCGNREGRIDE